jgi:hypothetical protein
MKTNNEHPYHTIDSFEDFRLERERLILKSKLIEARVSMEIILIRQYFSISNILVSFTREFVLPRITGFLEALLNHRNNNKE